MTTPAASRHILKLERSSASASPGRFYLRIRLWPPSRRSAAALDELPDRGSRQIYANIIRIGCCRALSRWCWSRTPSILEQISGPWGTQLPCSLAVHELCTSVYLPFYVPSFKFSSSTRSTYRCYSGSRSPCSPILERCSSSTFHGLKLRAASSSRRSTIDLNFGRRSSRSLEQPLAPISSSGRPQRR